MPNTRKHVVSGKQVTVLHQQFTHLGLQRSDFACLSSLDDDQSPVQMELQHIVATFTEPVLQISNPCMFGVTFEYRNNMNPVMRADAIRRQLPESREI